MTPSPRADPSSDNMKNTAAIIAVVLCLAWPAGCGIIEPGRARRPSWAVRPESAESHPGFLTAVGAGSAENIPDAVDSAEIDARRELSVKVRAYVADTLDAFFEANPVLAPERPFGVRQFTEAMISELTAYSMRRAVREEISTPDSKDRVYALYSVPLTIVNAAVRERAAVINRDHALFEPQREESIFEDLSAAFDSALKSRISAAARYDLEHGGPGDFSSVPPPQWLTTGRSSRYPSDHYLLATGLGANMAEAEKNARREALQQVAALARFRAASAAGREDAPGLPLMNRIAELPAARLQSFPDDGLELRIAEVWYDSAIDVHYALAVISRAPTARRCIELAAVQIEDWRERLKSGINHRQAENFREALDNLLLAAAAAETALQNCLTALVIAPPGLPVDTCSESLSEISLEETYLELNRLLLQFHIVPGTGPGQWDRPERSPRRPVSASVVAGTQKRPVPNMPVRFELQGDAAQFSRSAGSSVVVLTDREGLASAEVRRIRDIQRLEDIVLRVSLAVDTMLPEKRIHAALEIPYVHISRAAETGDKTALALRIRETAPDAGPASGSFTLQLARHLQNAGVVLATGDEVQLPAGAIQEAMDGKTDGVLGAVSQDILGLFPGDTPAFLALGTTHSQITDRRETTLGTLYFAVCRSELILFEAGETLETITRIEMEGLGATVGSEEDALIEARKDAALKTAEKILSLLRH